MANATMFILVLVVAYLAILIFQMVKRVVRLEMKVEALEAEREAAGGAGIFDRTAADQANKMLDDAEKGDPR